MRLMWISPLLATLLLLCGGCLTTRLMGGKHYPPEAYGELLGLERHGPGKDRFVYAVNGYSQLRGGYYWVQPRGKRRDRPPLSGRYPDRDAVPLDRLEPVTVAHWRDRNLADPPATEGTRERPVFRVVRYHDWSDRENHHYQLWSPRAQEWRFVGNARFGTDNYWKNDTPWYAGIVLPFALVLDLLSLPIQFIVWTVRGMIPRNPRLYELRSTGPPGVIVGAPR